MAGLALRIVSVQVRFQRLMRIVAGGAANSRIGSIVTLAVGEAIGLEADVVDVARSVRCNLGPGPMALPSEIGSFLRAHFR